MRTDNFKGGKRRPLESIRTHCRELCKNGSSDRDAIWDTDSDGPRKHVLDRDEHWRNLATEPSMRGSDAALRQITSTTFIITTAVYVWRWRHVD